MNVQKNIYNKPRNALENFLTGELTAASKINKKIQIQMHNMNEMGETGCTTENINFADSIRGDN